jgi:hypothetical protein
MIRVSTGRPLVGPLITSAVVAALLVLASSGAVAQRGGRGFGGGGHFGGGSHVSGFGHAGGFSHSLGGGHVGGSHFGGSIGSHVGHIDHGHFFHGDRFHGGGTSIFLGFGFGTGYYYPSYWYPYPYWYPDTYPVYVPDPYPVYVEPSASSVPTSRSGDNDYYLYRRPTVLPKDPELTAAIADIERAFRDNDIVLLERHVADDETIGVLSRGHTRQSFKGAEYLDKTREAYKSLKTVKFDLSQAEPVDHGDWRVSGTHVFKREDGKEVRFAVSFVFHKSHDRWMIREVSADPIQ